MALDVKIIRLITGEELLAEVPNYSDGVDKVTFKNPIRIVLLPGKTDSKTPTVALAPWGDFVDEKEFILDKSHVMYIMKPVQEFINQYNSIFGGIVAPSSKLIIPGS